MTARRPGNARWMPAPHRDAPRARTAVRAVLLALAVVLVPATAAPAAAGAGECPILVGGEAPCWYDDDGSDDGDDRREKRRGHDDRRRRDESERGRAGPRTEQEASERLLRLLNDERAARGLPAATLRDDVREVADGHAAAMARDGELRHNDAYFSDESRRRHRAARLGENVAVNTSIDDMHRRLMASEGHRANILDPAFTVVGVAVRSDGERWWATQDFVEPDGS